MEVVVHGLLMLGGFAIGWWAKGQTVTHVTYNVEKLDKITIDGPTSLHNIARSTGEDREGNNG